MALRRHRGAHNLLGTGQCRRLAKLVPNMAADNGTAALLNHAFIEWLAAPMDSASTIFVVFVPLHDDACDVGRGPQARVSCRKGPLR